MSKPLRVLLVEDSEDDAELVLNELRRGGYAPSQERVENAAALGRALAQQPWDIVISDYSLPGFSGMEALPICLQQGGDVPFLLVSGAIGEQVAVAAMKAGAHDYIMKKDLARLVPAVDRELREAKIRRERREALAALQRSEEMNRAVLNSLSAHIAVLDSRGIILAVNKAWTEFARANGVVVLDRVGVGTDYLAVCRHASGGDRTIADAALDGIERVLRGAMPEFILEYPCHSESVPRWFTLYATRLQFGGGGAVVAHQDITARKIAEDAMRESERQLRALTARLEIVREEERARISREVHDQLGQALTGLKMSVSWLRRKLDAVTEESVAPLRERCSSMSTLIDETIQHVRKISSDLRPGVLDDLGLAAALEWQAGEFEKQSGIRCILDTTSGVPGVIDRQRATAVFRMFQETLTNVARHSRASVVRVTLGAVNGRLSLEVRDNGRGITASEVEGSRSLGLLGMRERAAQVSGQVTVSGQPGTGTIVRIEVLLAN